MSTLATLTVKLIGDASELQSTITSASQSVQSAGRQMSQVGGDLTRNVTAPIVGIGTAAVLMGNKFNAGMANVISLAPDAAEEIAGLSGGVQDLAVEMGASTTDMTDGLYQVVSAFGLSGDSMDTLRANAMAAAAGLSTTTEAINLTSAVTKGYGDTTAEAVQHAADLALKTVQLGQTTFPELAASIGSVTPLAAALSVTQEELFGVMATATGVTGNAAAVSTQFRGVLQSLMSPTESMTAAFEQLGVTSGQQLIDIYGLEDGLNNIMQIAQASGQPLQAYIGSIEGQTLAMALAGPQADTWAQKTQALREAAGTTAAAFEAQTQGINANGFALQQNAIQMQVLSQQIGQALQPAITMIMPYVQQFIGWVQQLVQRFTELDPKTQTIILGVIGFAAALGPLLMVLGPIVTGIGSVGVVLGAVLSPIGLVVIAVAALAAAFATDFGGIRTTVVGIWEEHLLPIFTTLKEWLEVHIPPALATLSAIWTDTLKPAIEVVWAFIQQNVFPILEALVNVYIAAAKAELAALATVWATVLKPAIEVVWAFIQNNLVPIFETVLTWLRDNIPPALQTLSDYWQNTLKPAIEAVWRFINDYIVPLFEALVSVQIELLRLALRTLASYWEDTLKPAIEAVWNFLDRYIVPIFERLVSDFIADLQDALTELTRIWNDLVYPALEAVWRIITDNVAPAFVSIKEKLDGPVGTALRVIQTVIDAVAGALSSLAGAAHGLISALNSLAERMSSMPSLPSWLMPGSPTPIEIGFRGISSALGELTPMLDDLDNTISGMDVGALTDVGDALGVFADIVDAVAAIAGYAPTVIGPAAEVLVLQMKGLVRKIVRVAQEISDEMGSGALAEAAEAGQMLSDALRPWKDAVEAVNAIADFEPTVIGPVADTLAQQMLGLARKLARVIRELGPEVLQSAADAGQLLSDTLQPWVDAINVMNTLAEYTPQTIGPAIDAILASLPDLHAMGVEIGEGWLAGIVDGILGAIPKLEDALAQVAAVFTRPFEPGGSGNFPGGAPGGLVDPFTPEPGGKFGQPAPGGPVTVNISGPWYVREDADIKRIAEAVADLLGRRAATNKRLNVGWVAE